MIGLGRMPIGLFAFISFFCVGICPAIAKIPEPPNIFYGSVKKDGVVMTSGTVEFFLGDQASPVQSCALGSNPAAGSKYVVKIPMESLEPKSEGNASSGDLVRIYFDGQFATDAFIGDRGTVREFDITIGVNTLDTDLDGIPDDIEDEGCTSEFDPDSDGDGISDGIEDANQNGTRESNETDPCEPDTDGDGLSDGDEDINSNGIADANETDPVIWDTDGDGCGDGDEKAAGSDPLSNTSVPCIVCVDETYVCAGCTGLFECFYEIGTALDFAISEGNPHTLIKVFSGQYSENVLVSNPCKIQITEGTVSIVGP